VNLPIKTVSPERYGTLTHPGDSFSYDIYSQAGQAIRQPSGPGPLGELRVKRVIAIGESQSAFRMVTYINAIHPTAHIYDGFLVHSRGGAFGATLSEAPQTVIATPAATHVRGDVGVPVLTFQPEPDLTSLGYFVGPPVAINKDADGNALGGIRTPQVDVPIATFTGQQSGAIICQLFGSTTPFDAAKLASLYPTHKAFTSAYSKALKRAVKAGWVLKPDAKLIKKWAVDS